MGSFGKAKKNFGSLVFDIAIYMIAGFAALITIWPFIYVLSMSLSDPAEVVKQSIWLLPKGFTLEAYKKVVNYPDIWQSYRNTIFYTVTGTILNCLMSSLGAYPLTRKGLYGRKLLVYYLIIPMYFSGGLIPGFILINKLGLYNNFLVMIIPGMVSIWNIILMRTYFSTLPDSLFESAIVDGANDLQILFKMYLPLSKPILAVISIYTAVGIWNSWFAALIYLPNKQLHPLQMFLVNVLIKSSGDVSRIMASAEESEGFLKMQMTAQQIRYSIIIFSSLPIICVYPFLQKYFIKGALLGSLKE